MNSQQAPSGGRLSLARSLWLAALAALAGFGAVYLMAQPPDNARVAVQGDAAPGAASGTKPAAGQGGNEMAAFVRKSSPEVLPAFTFQDKDGRAITIADFKGRTVLLNLWATWCAPCRHEMPALDRLQAAMGSDKFEVVALSLDKDGVDKARKFLGEIKVSHLGFYIDQQRRRQPHRLQVETFLACRIDVEAQMADFDLTQELQRLIHAVLVQAQRHDLELV